MKAIVYRKYCSPDVLEYGDVDKPVPNDDEVLIKVEASALNAFDWHLLRGKPFLYARTNQKDLSFIADLVEAGKVKPVIDRRYPLRDAAEAIRYLEKGHAKGKVILET